MRKTTWGTENKKELQWSNTCAAFWWKLLAMGFFCNLGVPEGQHDCIGFFWVTKETSLFLFLFFLDSKIAYNLSFIIYYPVKKNPNNIVVPRWSSRTTITYIHYIEFANVVLCWPVHAYSLLGCPFQMPEAHGHGQLQTSSPSGKNDDKFPQNIQDRLLWHFFKTNWHIESKYLLPMCMAILSLNTK